MKRLNKHFTKLFAYMICLLVILEAFCLPAFATDNTDTVAPNQSTEEDSTFVLANSDVQISDDYVVESAYISEIESSIFNENSENNVESILDTEAKTVGDPMVYLTQKWLNQEYGNVSGFGSVPENGRTGWDTVYGLLRALQHELGITSLANSFGPTTSNLYAKNPLYRQDGVTDKKFAILQGALWCKGYSPGYYLHENADGTVTFDEIFNADVERAVIQLKQDAGFTNPNGTVTLNVMKALMSMDSFKLLSSYGGDPTIRAMQQKLNRKYEAYTGLNPCDGVYGRNTNKAIVYALQAEEGLPTSVANGNFGTTTKLCCPELPYARNSSAARRYPGTSAGAYYSSSQLSALTELLQFALYVNGFGDGVTDGVFDSGTQQALRAFQSKYAIPQTGKADKGTWLSLFISCGDTDRPAKAADCATILTAAKAKTLYDNGYRYIGRYLTGTYNGGISKAITREEANIIFNAGLNFFPIYQTSARTDTYFTEAQGIEDAKAAITAATKLGVPQNTIIYFAVDFDSMDYQITSNILPYFKRVSEVMKSSIYRTGIYGTRNACIRVAKAGYTVSSFVGDMSTGFSGNLGFSMPDNWAFDQFKTISLGSGAGYIEIDKNGFSGRDHGVSSLDAAAPDTTLPEISFGTAQNDTLKGPTINLLGMEIPLFEMNIGLEGSFDGITTEYDAKEQSYKITIGLAEAEADPAVKTDAYAEIKKMINTFGGDTSRATWNNFQKMRSKLAKKKLSFGFEFDAQFAGYIKLAKTPEGGLKLVEGGLLASMEAATSLSYPLAPPIIFAKFELEGSVEAGLNFVFKNAEVINTNGSLQFSLTPKLGIEARAIVANAYGGLSGTLECELGLPCTSLQEQFKAKMHASLFFECNILSWEESWNLDFPDLQLYPRTNTKSVLSITADDLKLIEPIKKNTKSYATNSSNVFSENMPIYSQPQIINLGNGKMLMAYIDDAQNRSPENRTILMYSVFDGSNWSAPLPVLDDATGDFQPVIYPDGNGGAHIVWQNATRVFASGASMDEMAAGMDLYYTHWTGSAFNSTTAVTNNNDYETGYKIVSSGDKISIVWQQNSENDALGINGTNSIYRKQFSGGAWKNTETVATGLRVVNSIDTAYNNSNNVVAYTTKTTDDSSTINDLEVFYFDGSNTSRLTNDSTADYSVTFLDSQLYWISNSAIYSVVNGNPDSKSVVISGLANDVSTIEMIKNANGQKAIVWTQEDEAGVKFYGARYNAATGQFGASVPLSEGDDFVRGWGACMQENGEIELSYCAAEKSAEPVNGKPYGQIDLIQTTAKNFCDISVNPVAFYDGEVKPDNEIVLTADVYNSGSESVSQFDVSVFNADNVVKTVTVDKELDVGVNGKIEIPFTLPSSISKTDYKVKVVPHSKTDVSLVDNDASFTIGYSDLVIKDVQENRIDSGRQLKITVANQGYETIDSAALKVLNGSTSGELLQTNQISQLAPGAEMEFTYNVAESSLNPIGSNTPKQFYLLAATSVSESDYGNNTREVSIYSDYAIGLTAGNGGTVQGAGNYAYNFSATVVATPNSGYIFAGWYENGKLLDALTQEYTFTVLSNRSLEARYIPNNLNITGVEVFGTLQIGSEITFTADAEGGNQPYKWEFYIHKGDEICYSNNNAMVNFVEWTPTETGSYTVVAYVTDKSGFRVSYSNQFTVA